MRRGEYSGNAGQGSNWIRRVKRLRIYARDGWRCVWCARRVRTARAAELVRNARVACLDHVVPRGLQGSNEASNLLTSCMQCNEARGAKDVRAFAFALVYERHGFVHGELLHSVIDILDRVVTALTTPLPHEARK